MIIKEHKEFRSRVNSLARVFSRATLFLTITLLADHVDRWTGQRATPWHQNHEGAVRRTRSADKRKIHPESNAAEGSRQHNLHVPKSKCRGPYTAKRQTSRRGTYSVIRSSLISNYGEIQFKSILIALPRFKLVMCITDITSNSEITLSELPASNEKSEK